MSGVDIRSGGVVAVDSTSLYRTAWSLDLVEREIADAGVNARGGGWMLGGIAGVIGGGTVGEVEQLAVELERLSADARDLTAKLRSAAATYEYVELSAAREAAAGDTAALARIDGQMEALRGVHPKEALAGIEAMKHRSAFDVLAAQWAADGAMLGPGGALLGAGLAALAGGMVTMLGRGRVARGERLVGAPVPVIVRPVGHPSGSAPSSLAAASRRIPSDAAARVRIERYTMPDGSRQFAVYITGTRSFGAGGPEVFDGQSNIDLYDGRRSASYDAVLEALRQSGAEPGDVVHEFGHSQGGMIASRVATGSGYDVRTLVTFGSPIEAELPDTTLSVAVRHTDEAVQALAGGGSPARVGAPGSFVAERLVDPMPRPLQDLQQSSHDLTKYTETAAMLDASDDVRMDGVRDVFADLRRATSVAVVEYSATRPDSAG